MILCHRYHLNNKLPCLTKVTYYIHALLTDRVTDSICIWLWEWYLHTWCMESASIVVLPVVVCMENKFQWIPQNRSLFSEGLTKTHETGWLLVCIHFEIIKRFWYSYKVFVHFAVWLCLGVCLSVTVVKKLYINIYIYIYWSLIFIRWKFLILMK